jgi:hypothetical protein
LIQDEVMHVMDEDERLPRSKVKLIVLLHNAIVYYSSTFQRQRDKKNLGRIRRLRKIAKAAGRLAELLDPVDDRKWMKAYFGNETLFSGILGLPARAIHEVGILENKMLWGDDGERIGRIESRDRAVTLRTRSPFEWLVGSYLPETFRICFRKERRLRRRTSDGKLYGPYVQFAEQVLIEFGITKNGRPYGREAIAKAFSDVKHGRIRRAPRRR